MGFKPETPFDSIESAKQYVEILIEAIEESRRDVDADIARAKNSHSERKKRVLQLAYNNLAKLKQHMTTSRGILNGLRTLRCPLLKERAPDKHLQTANDHHALTG